MRGAVVNTFMRTHILTGPTLFALLGISMLFAATLMVSFAFGADTAYAQRTSDSEASSLELGDTADPRDPRPPFGYGGGPRDPNPASGRNIVDLIFERLAQMFSRFVR